MDISIAMIALCIGAPFILSLFITEKETRIKIFFLLVGFGCCAASGAANSFIISHMESYNEMKFSAYYAPIVEEIIKMLPVLIYCVAFKPGRKPSLAAGMCVGIGFGVIENVYYLITTASKISSIQWICARGFATALMHALCTAAVAFMLEMAYRRRKLYLPGTVAALALAINYHSIYNIIVKTEYREIILFMPIVTYLLILICIKAQMVRKKVRSK